MKFDGIEHYDVFEGDVIIFWADISDLPQTIQDWAREIDGSEFSPESFGICVNYSFEDKEFYVVIDTGMMGKDKCNIFYIDQDGDKNWFELDIPQEIMNQIIDQCTQTVAETEAELEKQSAAYEQPDDLQRDSDGLADDQQRQETMMIGGMS